MKETKRLVSRRQFVATAATATIAGPLIFGQAAQAASRNGKLNHASIGVGGMGFHDLQQFKSHPNVQIVALCDVDANNLKKASDLIPGARLYSDWRELFKKEGKKIDSVNVTVPDHNHFAIAMQALRNGKHVYCQKPMCHDVAEVRMLTQTAVKAGVITQLGTQIASGKGDRRAWQDFGTGWSGDIGCHIFDAVWKGLGLKPPISVVAEVQQSWKDSPERRADTWPQGDHITWMFPGNDYTEDKILPLEWFDGAFYPPQEIRSLYNGKEYPAESAMLIGTEGALLIPHGGMPVLLPEDKFKAHTLPELEERNHYHHFVDACLGGPKTESHFAQSGPMTEAIILGTVAIRVPGQLLEWDTANMKFPNHPEAEKYLRRTYRKGWEVKGI